MGAEQQTDLLANYIMKNHPEEITDGGAGDVAVKVLKKSVVLNYTETSILIEALSKHTKSDGSLGTYAERLLERLVEHKDAMYNDDEGVNMKEE